MSEGTQEICRSAFSDCYNLTSITIPDGVTVIKTGAFRDCPGLTTVTIPASVWKVEDEGFYCDDLIVFIGGAGLTSAEMYSFTIPNRIFSDVRIYYSGSEERFAGFRDFFGDYYYERVMDMVAFYSESEPTSSGRYRHYDADGNVALRD